MRQGLAAIALAPALGVVDAWALAASGDGHAGRLSERIDGDGAATGAEMTEAVETRIARRVAKMFARIDRNGDGRVERAELDARGHDRFARLDADGDGRVTVAEIGVRWQPRRHGHEGEA